MTDTPALDALRQQQQPDQKTPALDMLRHEIQNPTVDATPALNALRQESSDTNAKTPALDMLRRQTQTEATMPVPPKSEQLGYGLSKSTTLYSEAQDWLTAHAPQDLLEISNKISNYLHQYEKYTGGELGMLHVMGLSRQGTDAIYGPDFSQMTPEQRFARMRKIRAQKQQENYPNMVQYGDTPLSKTSEIAGSFADPTLLLPFGEVGKAKTFFQIAKKTSPFMATYMGLDEALHEEANSQDLNFYSIGGAAVAGAILAPVVPWVTGKAVSRVSRFLADKTAKASAEILDGIQTKLITKVAEGKPKFQAIQETLAEKDMKMEDLNRLMRQTNTDTAGLFFPKDQAAAQHIAVDAQPVGWRPWKSGSWLDDMIQPIITRIGDISQKVKLRLSRMEMNIHARAYNLEQSIEPIFKAGDKLSNDGKELFIRAWNSRDLTTLERLFGDDEAALKALKRARGMFESIYGEYKTHVDPKLTYLTDFLPRLVSKYDKLRKAMGREARNALDTAISDATSKKGSALTDLEKADVVGKWLRGYPREQARASFRKARVFTDQIPDELLPYYASPRDATHAYIRRAIADIEKAKFFGSKNIKLKSIGNGIDSDESIASMIARDPELLKMGGEKAAELRKLLRARFDMGEQAPSKFISFLRNITYLGTIGNPLSTITQSQDVAFTAAQESLTNVLRSMHPDKALEVINAALFGLQKASEELAESSMASARALDWVLKHVGFENMDLYGKTLNLRSHYLRYVNLAKTEKGIKEISKEWGTAYGEHFTKLIDDLKNQRITNDTMALLWSKLEEIQPISKSSMSYMYLTHPNMRLLYALNTFTMKQVDYVRTKIFREFAKGDIKSITRGARNLGRFVAFMSAAGVSTTYLKNWILGRETSSQDWKLSWTVAFLKNFAASPIAIYKIYQAAEKQKTPYMKVVKGAQTGFQQIGQNRLPIYDIVSTVGNDLFKLMEMGNVKEAFSLNKKIRTYPSLRYTPIIGPFLYNFLGGGLERWNEREKQRKKKSYGF